MVHGAMSLALRVYGCPELDVVQGSHIKNNAN
jgi:hypothetical protein